MSRYMTNISVKEMLNSWSKAGLVAPATSQAIETFTLDRYSEQDLPIYLRILIGIGAFISSLFLIASLSISKIISFRSEAGLIVWGVLLIGAAIFLARTAISKRSTAWHSFIMQTSFCLIGVGKVLFVAGAALLFKSHSEWGVTFGILFISVATYHVYRMSIDRFLSALAVLTSVFVNILISRTLGSSQEFILNSFFVIQLALTGFLFTSTKVKREYLPIAYAAAASLCIAVLFFSSQAKIGWGHREHYSLFPVNISLAAALIGLIGWVAGSLKKFLTEPLLLACLGAVLLGSISAPGIVLSIGLLILGYSKHERLLVQLGTFMMPCFIVLYYYNLEVSLLAKSEILLLSGVVLLIGRLYLYVRKLDREEVI